MELGDEKKIKQLRLNAEHSSRIPVQVEQPSCSKWAKKQPPIPYKPKPYDMSKFSAAKAGRGRPQKQQVKEDVREPRSPSHPTVVLAGEQERSLNEFFESEGINDPLADVDEYANILELGEDPNNAELVIKMLAAKNKPMYCTLLEQIHEPNVLLQTGKLPPESIHYFLASSIDKYQMYLGVIYIKALVLRSYY